MNASPTPFVGPVQPEPLDLSQLLIKLDKSGKSKAAFAREHGVPVWKIYNGLKARAKRKRKHSQPQLLPVRVSDDTSARSAPIELVLTGGHRLLVPSNFDENSLRRLMGVLAGC